MSGLQSLRERAGLTIKQLALLMDVTFAEACEWETGARTPGMDKLPKLAYMLRCKMEEVSALFEAEQLQL